MNGRKMLLAREEVILWVIPLLHYNARRQIVTFLNTHGDVKSWVRVTNKFLDYCPPSPHYEIIISADFISIN